jgi:phage tail-like protein
VATNLAAQFIFGGFSECQGLNCELETETYQEGGRNDAPHRLVKWAKPSNLVLKHGVTFNPGIWDWYAQVLNGGTPQNRKNGMIMLLDRGGPGLVGGGLPGLDRTPIAVWTFQNGLPEKVQGPTLNAKGNEIAIETLEISHEGLQRVSASMIPGLGDVGGAIGGAVAGAAVSVGIG